MYGVRLALFAFSLLHSSSEAAPAVFLICLVFSVALSAVGAMILAPGLLFFLLGYRALRRRQWGWKRMVVVGVICGAVGLLALLNLIN